MKRSKIQRKGKIPIGKANTEQGLRINHLKKPA